MKVTYLTQLRRASGRASDEVDGGPRSLADLLTLLSAERPELAVLLQSRSLLVFRGEDRLTRDAIIYPADELTLMTPIAGGSLSEDERAVYEWQMWTDGVGEEGQERLKGATVLISRIGGVGGAVAQALALAGVGRLLLAHAGEVQPSDLNRQVLMTHAGLGRPRIEMATESLRRLNPWVEVHTSGENVSEASAERLVAQADVVVSAAPLFSERLALNRAAILHRKPLIDCAMYDFTAQVITIQPRHSACLACIYREDPPAWRRQFPVFGAVSGFVGHLGAVEVIKLITGLGEPLTDRLLVADLSTMTIRRVKVARDPACPVCGDGHPNAQKPPR